MSLVSGWSDSKKSWCCDKEQKGCVEHHCFTGDISEWHEASAGWNPAWGPTMVGELVGGELIPWLVKEVTGMLSPVVSQN